MSEEIQTEGEMQGAEGQFQSKSARQVLSDGTMVINASESAMEYENDPRKQHPDVKVWLREGVPFEGDVPQYYDAEKYPTIEDQLKANVGLRQALGRAGNHKAPEEYEIHLDEKYAEKYQIGKEDPLLNEFTGLFKEINLPQEAFDKILNKYVDVMGLQEQKSEEQMNAELDAEIAKLGPNGQKQIEQLDNWARNKLNDHLYNRFQQSITSHEDVLMWEMIRSNNAVDQNIPGNMDLNGAPRMTRDEARKLLTDPRMNKSAEFTKYVEDVYKNLRYQVK